MQLPDLSRYVLVVVDVQQGFDDPWWGTRNNAACDRNLEALVDHWAADQRSLVYVQHDSANPDSPLHPSAPGHTFKPYLQEVTPDLVVTKQVNSSFHGTPDLDDWLRHRAAAGIVVCGITTNHCCETTARVGGNLGHDVLFAIDATYTFDREDPDGHVMTADELTRATATNLHGEFATVVSSVQLLGGTPSAAQGEPRVSGPRTERSVRDLR